VEPHKSASMTPAPQAGWLRARPSPLLRWAMRLPTVLYRLHLGWLLGHRFVLLTHRGRRTGRIRRTVLEVVRYDRRTGEVIVAAGWGARSAWYRNLQARPALAISIGRTHYRPVQRFLSPAEVELVLRDYQRRHPLLARYAIRLLRMPRGCLTPVPMVAFRPPPKSPGGARDDGALARHQ
jgi:deazaflavin-dependent oxidoreductase (nitroreductase family)